MHRVHRVHRDDEAVARGAPIFLGATASGGAHPDVAAVHGQQFKDSGFGLIVQGLPAGDYDLALFAWSTERMNFVPRTVVPLGVRPVISLSNVNKE